MLPVPEGLNLVLLGPLVIYDMGSSGLGPDRVDAMMPVLVDAPWDSSTTRLR